jgi:hypothetical protein
MPFLFGCFSDESGELEGLPEVGKWEHPAQPGDTVFLENVPVRDLPRKFLPILIRHCGGADPADLALHLMEFVHVNTFLLVNSSSLMLL